MAKAAKLTDEEKVADFMRNLEHPLKAETEAVRAIIKAASDKISERIKWNAPSYYYRADIVTFNPRARQQVHLVFHHPAVASIASPILEGDYKDRRMAYFRNMEQVETGKAELQKVLRQLVKIIDTQTI